MSFVMVPSVFSGLLVGGELNFMNAESPTVYTAFLLNTTGWCPSGHRARMFHESLAATTDMVVLPGVLGCRPLRRTVQVRLGPIPRYRGTVARWHAHLCGLATAIHETSGLKKEICYELDPTTLPRIRILQGSQIICLQVQQLWCRERDLFGRVQQNSHLCRMRHEH